MHYYRRRVLLLGAAALGSASTLAWLGYTKGKKTINEQNINVEAKKALVWKAPSRAELVDRLKGEPSFDVLIIGAGATGSGCAVDAAQRGLKTLCVDQGDYASGTSSKSTKLVHGGVRYLEAAVKSLSLAQFAFVQEALEERGVILKIAPHLCGQLPIMLPVYGPWWQVGYYWIGAKAYDAVSRLMSPKGSFLLDNSYFLNRTQALKAFPMIKPEALKGAVVYYDGQMDDARLNVTLAQTAIYNGATVLNYVKVNSLLKDDLGRVIGAILKDQETGEEYRVHSAVTVNAGGPFADSIQKLADPNHERILQASSGVHIVLPSYYAPAQMGLVDPKTKDGRVLFFLPWNGNTLAGTTDVPEDYSAVVTEPIPLKRDIQFILEGVSRYLALPVRESDVLAAWSGIRPLVKPEVEHPGDTKSTVRSHIAKVDAQSGMVSILGGKWTTYRRMASDTIDVVCVMLGREGLKSQTQETPLIGAHRYRQLGYLHLIQHFGLATDVAMHLHKSYGDRTLHVLMHAEPCDGRWPPLGKRLNEAYPMIEAEVRYAVRHEYALHAEDILARRTRLAFLSVQAAKDALPRALEIMQEELGWSPEKVDEERKRTCKFFMSMGLEQVKEARGELNKEQFLRLKRIFASDPSMTRELKQVLDELGMNVTCESDVKVSLQEFLDYLDLDNFKSHGNKL